MSNLTREQMEAAHFVLMTKRAEANGFGIAADLEIDSDDPVVARSSREELDRRKSVYNEGAEILKKYVVTFGPRVMAGIATEIPADSENYIVVDDGYIATSAAVRAVGFKERK